MNITAYVPCFNNVRTLPDTVKSIKEQTVPVDELFVVDDGSSDGSDKLAQELGCRVIRHEKNLGRGPTRARAISEASCELVLGCDATNVIPPDFVERSLPWFESDNVAAVFGRMWQEDNSTVAQRWRGRHLFKMDADLTVNDHASLSTGAVLLRSKQEISIPI
jgi:glycosyltransferase involved in cell wall biosynthesis